MFTFVKSILVIVFGLVFGLGTFLAPAANASEPTTPTPVVDATSDQASVPDSEAKVVAQKIKIAKQAMLAAEEPSAPQVSLSNLLYARASFEASGTAAASASLKTKTGVKVVLNVSANPIPKNQIKRCWAVKPGTVVWNEVIDPVTGTRKVIRWVVPMNDNIFCYKKGRGKQVFKKSCDNREWGVPGGPKNPPSSLPRIKVKVKIQDYLSWSGTLAYKGKQGGSATAHVVQYDGDRKICEAMSWLDGSIVFDLKMYISVRSRTRTGISVAATSQVKTKASTSTTVAGTLKYEFRIHLKGKALAWCDVPPSPPVYDQPDVQVTAVGCVEPGQTRNVTVTVFNPNENTTDETATLTFPGKTPETKAIASPGHVTFTLSNVGAGTYSGSVRLNKAAKSKSFTVNVEECPPVVRDKPSIDLTVEACVPGATVLDVSAVVGNPNDDPSGGTIKFGSQSPVTFGSIPAGGSSAPIVFQNVSPGTYTVTATLTAFNTTATTQVVVPNCPPVQPPVFVQFGEFNDLEVNWTSSHCVTVDTPAGHTATVYWDATFGSFAAPQKTAQDGVQICSIYKAPSEVPAGGTDRITVRAVDNVTDLSVTKTTEPFVIHPTAPHPG